MFLRKGLVCCLLPLLTWTMWLPADEEITVHLSTESRLLPLYLSSFEAEGSTLSDAYIEELGNILRFDLMYNGVTQVLPTTSERERFVTARHINSQEYAKEWPGPQVFYLVRGKIAGKTLTARVVSVAAKTVKGVELSLTGELSEDRRTMHELADLVHRTLFGKAGIATTRMLYTVRTKNPNPRGPEYLSEVWEADWDGGNPRQVTHENAYVVTPSYLLPQEGYAPNHFFYVSYKTGQPKVYIGSLDGQPARRFTYLRGNQLMPEMAPTRDQVAFICDAGGNPDLFLQRFSPDTGPIGKPFQIYASERGTQASPAFHPSGREVAFVSNKDGVPRIYLMHVPHPGAKLKQIHPKLLTKVNRENTAPSWSPDGTKLAYCAKTNGTRQIWIYDFRTGRETQLTSGPGHKENPSWAPNSLHLVFNSSDVDSSELYIVNLNQPTAVRISSGPGEKRFPCWEPRKL